MEKHIYDEKNGLSYTLYGDYYLPDLALNEEEPIYGKYGMLRKQFLNLVICDIDETTLNAQKIKELRKISLYPIYSFQCLLSKAYDHVITNHKMTLLLHVIDLFLKK